MRGASLVKLTMAAAVGATLAYVFDPVRGRRRRAELKDRGRATVRREMRAAERQASYGKGRAEGVIHKFRHPRPHVPEDDMTLADKIVVLRAGRVEQVGRPLDLYDNPVNQFVAGFIGSPRMNFLAAESLGGGRQLLDHRRVAGSGMAEPAFGTAALDLIQFPGLDRALGQQPRDDVHDAGRHLERFAGEPDPGEELEPQPLALSDIVEIGARLVGEQHRFGVQGIHQARCDPRFGAIGVKRVVHRSLFVARYDADTNAWNG